jgi:thiol-disulfide isomerase/thioredoxin
MYKTILTIVMATLCLYFKGTAQQTMSKTKVNPAIKPVQIGQRMPDVVLTHLHNYKTTRLDLADLETKLIIIDFWATWCGPCVSMVPKIDSLQREFQYDVQFISVSYQTAAEVTSFMEKLEKQNNVHYTVPYVSDDNSLRFLFPHKTLPHYVWISSNGTVRAITELKEITSANIDKMLASSSFTLPEKKDSRIPYDYSKPFMVNGNGGDGKGLMYHSALSGYVEGLPGKTHLERADSINVDAVVLTNCAPIWLYKIAYSKGLSTFYPDTRVLLEVKHPEELTSSFKGNAYLDWLRKDGHGICYELRVPKHAAAQLHPLFKQNLAMLFPQYSAAVEKRMVKCLALVRLPGADNLQTKHKNAEVIQTFEPFGFTMQNCPLSSFVNHLKLKYLSTQPLPIVNETGYTGRVDMKITAKLSSIPDMNRALEPYHLAWQEKMMELDMLVIKDADQVTATTDKGL